MSAVRRGASRSRASATQNSKSRRTSQLDTTYEYIRDQIARGDVEPGAKLSRRKLADEIGVSPALVQHALGQLEKAGLVVCRARSGTYVRELTTDDFASLYDIRELVEPYAAARAAERITPQQVKILELSCRRYQALREKIPKTTRDIELWRIHHALVEEEQVFHGTIVEAAGNSMLGSLIQSLQLLGQVRHKFAIDALWTNVQVTPVHQNIASALKIGQPELARARMLEHLQNRRTALEERMRQDDPRIEPNGEDLRE